MVGAILLQFVEQVLENLELLLYFSVLPLHILICLIAELLVVIVPLVLVVQRLLSNLLELFELLVDVFLDFVSLNQQHLPLFDVVDGLVIMRNQIPFHQGTVPHE